MKLLPGTKHIPVSFKTMKLYLINNTITFFTIKVIRNQSLKLSHLNSIPTQINFWESIH